MENGGRSAKKRFSKLIYNPGVDGIKSFTRKELDTQINFISFYALSDTKVT